VLTPEQWTKLNDRHRGRGRDGFQLHGPPVTPNPSPAPSPAPNPPGR
jgi:hypothetical protein